MNWIDYRKNASRTFADVHTSYQEDIIKSELKYSLNELHCVIGIVTEIHEYGIAIDTQDMVNAAEEIGDALWYVANMENIKSIKPENLQDNIIVEWDMGLFDLSQELLDIYKKKVFYRTNKHDDKIGKYLNTIKVMLFEMCKVYGFDSGKILQTNIDKLMARYPEKFNTHDADNRNLKKERNILEGGQDA